jgi:hypothetical protein
MATYLSHNNGPRIISHERTPEAVNTEDIGVSVAAAIAQASAVGGRLVSGDSGEEGYESTLEDGPTVVAGAELAQRECEQNAELDAWVNQGMVDDTPAGDR